MEVSASASQPAAATAKRSAWARCAIGLQALWAVVLIVISFYLLAHTPRSPGHALTLRLTGVMFGVPGIIAAAGCCGLWKSRRWGWWLSFIPDGLIASIFIYAVIDDARLGIVDGTLVGTTVLAGITPLYLLLPPVKRRIPSHRQPRTGEAGAHMKRSGWIAGTVVAQAVWTLALVALPIYLFGLAQSHAILNGPSGAEAASGLKIAAAVFVPPALLAMASCYGLWKEKLWGWWLAFVSNTLVLLVMIYSMTDENTIDWDMFALTAISAVLPTLLLLPVVRRFYWGGAQQVQTEPSL